jgi:16S rRNA (adenine1518-N6/adenine1519-N6)-dimethyltransferase
MNKSDLCAVLAELGVRPSRKLGQNFLLDPNLLDALLRGASLQAGEHILEVGPGAGVLTARLLAAGCMVTAVELDWRLAAYIQRSYGHLAPRFRLIQGDACKQDYEALMGDEPFRCVANLPYSCSSPFLAIMGSLANPPQELHVLLQKEMADRLTAPPHSKDYGALTVRLTLRYEITLVRTVPPEVFFPAPDVMSAFVRMRLRAERPTQAQWTAATGLANLAFSQRRKQARRLLGAVHPPAAVTRAFALCGLAEDARAEDITPAQFMQLAAELTPATTTSS